MQQTIFHKILRKDVPATVRLETEEVFAFDDIHPKDRTHILFIPKEHLAIASVIEAKDNFAHVPDLLIQTARVFAAQNGITGYKLQFNVGESGGQEVPYIHLHFISPHGLE